MRSCSDSPLAGQRGSRAGAAFEDLFEALARIAFGLPLDQHAMRARLEHDPGARAELEKAMTWLFEAGSDARIRLRGRYVTDYYSDEQAALADTEDIPPARIMDFPQGDLDKGGLRRRPHSHDIVVGAHAPQAAFDRAFATWAADEAEAPNSVRLAEGYRDLQVSRDDLKRELRGLSSGRSKVGRPAELDHNAIRAQARKMRAEQPNLSIGSAAAAIAIELPRNPRTGKMRDGRGLERIIAPIWESGGDEIH